MNPHNKHPNSLVAYCIEQVVSGRTVAEVARDKGVTTTMVSRWLEKHWFGSRQYADFIVMDSKINITESSDNIEY